MLKVCLLTVEDKFPERIYRRIHHELSEWLFVKRNIVCLQRPVVEDQQWVTNLEDWRRVIVPLSDENDLVFCTVDLSIPESSQGDVPNPQHGLTILREIEEDHLENVRCCVITGLSMSELQRLLGKDDSDLLIEFKSDLDQGSRNIANYIKSQALALMERLSFPDSAKGQRQILLREQTGHLREAYLSKAPYFADDVAWHVPALIVGERGLGRQTFVEFLAHLAGAKLERISLIAESLDANQDIFSRLTAVLGKIESIRAEGSSEKFLYHFDGLDQYDPESKAEGGRDCLVPLQRILDCLRTVEVNRSPPFPVGIAFSVSGHSMLRIRSPSTRTFIRDLQSYIVAKSGFPLDIWQLDRHAGRVDHPGVVRLPTLRESGKGFITSIISDRLQALSESLHHRLPLYKDQPLTLATDVLDFLVDKTDWSKHGNIGGLVNVLDDSFERFTQQRAANQFQITRAHLSQEFRERFLKIVLNMDDVRLEYPSTRGGRLVVVEKADFQVEEGEMLVVLGPSGCGKSTVLRMLAGLMKPTSGTVSYRGSEVTGPTEKIGFVFQAYTLYPWLRVRQNIEFGPRMRGIKPHTIWPIVENLIDIADLKGFEDAYPHQLSGGMQQRVAIMQSLANDPDVLLMDEPFGALDVQTRWLMQDFVIRAKNKTRKSIVFVTHDIDEAVYVGDRIYVSTPRPLRLSAQFVVPFSPESRRNSLRRDPAFVTLVNRVREALLEAATPSTDMESQVVANKS